MEIEDMKSRLLGIGGLGGAAILTGIIVGNGGKMPDGKGNLLPVTGFPGDAGTNLAMDAWFEMSKAEYWAEKAAEADQTGVFPDPVINAVAANPLTAATILQQALAKSSLPAAVIAAATPLVSQLVTALQGTSTATPATSVPLPGLTLAPAASGS